MWCRHLLPLCCLQPLLPSLRELNATMAPVESICQLTALQRLVLKMITTTPGNPSRLGMLGRLTSFQLRCADCTDWSIFEGCTGLRALHLGSASCLLRAALVWVFQHQLCPTLLMQVV